MISDCYYVYNNNTLPVFSAKLCANANLKPSSDQRAE